MPQVAVQLDEDITEALTRAAERDAVTPSDWARNAIVHQLQRTEPAGGSDGRVTGPAAIEVSRDLLDDPNYRAYEQEKAHLLSTEPGKFVGYCRGQRVALSNSFHPLPLPTSSRIFRPAV